MQEMVAIHSLMWTLPYELVHGGAQLFPSLALFVLVLSGHVLLGCACKHAVFDAINFPCSRVSNSSQPTVTMACHIPTALARIGNRCGNRGPAPRGVPRGATSVPAIRVHGAFPGIRAPRSSSGPNRVYGAFPGIRAPRRTSGPNMP